MITPEDRAAARVCLRALSADGEFAFSAVTLRRSFSASVLNRIRDEEKDARAANKAAKEGATLMLSGDAGQYVEDTTALIARGKAAQASGDEAWVKRISQQSERLEETFDERVPDGEKKYFKHLDPQRHAETWDDRWSYLEFAVPLLCDDARGGYQIPNVKNYAQKMVLATLTIEEQSAEQLELAGKNSLALRHQAWMDDGYTRAEIIKKEAEAAKRLHVRSLSPADKKARAKRLKAEREAVPVKPPLKTINLADVQGDDA